MLGYIATNEPSNTPAPTATSGTANAPGTMPVVGAEVKDAPTQVQPDMNPSITITGVDKLTAEPAPLQGPVASSLASQPDSRPIRVFIESKGTQTLERATPPPSPSTQKQPSSQFRPPSAPAPAHTQDTTQASYSNSGRRTSRNIYLDPLPPLPESVNIPSPAKGLVPTTASGSNRNGTDVVSDNNSREGVETDAPGRTRAGSAVIHTRATRNSTYDDKEFGIIDREKAMNGSSLSRGTTLVGSKHFPVTPHHSSTSKKSLAERLQPTLDTAISQRAKYTAKARRTGVTLNVAIGAQVFLGALVTGLSAIGSGTGKSTGTATAVLGGFSTLCASYLARARGSSEPELSITRVKDLEHFTRECQAFMMDYGHIVIDDDDAEKDASDRELEQRVFRLRERFEELLGNGSGERKLSPPV